MVWWGTQRQSTHSSGSPNPLDTNSRSAPPLHWKGLRKLRDGENSISALARVHFMRGNGSRSHTFNTVQQYCSFTKDPLTSDRNASGSGDRGAPQGSSAKLRARALQLERRERTRRALPRASFCAGAEFRRRGTEAHRVAHKPCNCAKASQLQLC